MLKLRNEKRQSVINSVQIKREKDDCNQRNKRRVSYFNRGRPRYAAQFGARIAQEMRDALNESFVSFFAALAAATAAATPAFATAR